MFGAVLGGLLGAVAGGQKDVSSSTQSMNLAAESDLEKQAREAQGVQFQDLLKLLGGQSISDIQAQQGQVSQAQGGLDQLLAAFAQSGGMPSQTQVGQAQQYAQQMFAPQQVAMQQAFQDQSTAASQQAARMGRSFGNDPILRARLAQEQTRQQAQLGAQQGAFAAQYAQQLPGQAIGAHEALINLRQGIASQAMQNRLNLLNLGSQLQNQERNFRFNTASRTTSQEGGGGIKGAIGGAFAGVGAGLSAYGKMKDMGMFNQQQPFNEQAAYEQMTRDEGDWGAALNAQAAPTVARSQPMSRNQQYDSGSKFLYPNAPMNQWWR